MLRNRFMALVSVAALGLAAVSSASAADTGGLTYDFSALQTTIESGLQSPITVGITVGAGVFIILYGIRLLKRGAK